MNAGSPESSATHEDQAVIQHRLDAINALLLPLPEPGFVPTGFAEETLHRTAHAAGRLAWEAISQRHRAEHDNLTGLRNKETWTNDVSERILQNEAFGLAFLDLDSFKKVNDKLGHQEGDQLLANFGTHMKEKFKRKDDMLKHVSGRLGGDEFGTIFNLSHNNRRAKDKFVSLENEANYLQASVNTFLEGVPEKIRKLGFDISIGIALFDPAVPVDAKTLIDQADAAMYQAKLKHKAERRTKPDRRRKP